MNTFWTTSLLQVIFFLLSLLLSTLLIRLFIILPQQKTASNPATSIIIGKKTKPVLKDPGFWIGFFEHIIIFVFVTNKEFSALAIIFAAKAFVRKEDIAKNPAYYLLGTLINFGVALLAIELYLKLYQI